MWQCESVGEGLDGGVASESIGEGLDGGVAM